jgi:hypothetical protein
MLGIESGTKSDGSFSSFHRRAASPQDYLEKIFQVPFTLPRVQQDGFVKLIEGTFPLASRNEKASNGKRDQSAQAPLSPVPQTTPPVGSPAVGTPGVPGNPPPGPAVPGVSNVPASLTVGGTSAIGATLVATVEREFYLEENERKFMAERLSAFMRTPRLIKRFANVYRMLRLGVEEKTYPSFVGGDRDAACRCVQVLLALNVGFPRVAADLLRQLAWPEFAAAPFQDFSTFIRVTMPKRARGATAAQSEFDEALALLTALEPHVPRSQEVWSHWAKEVGRYSMYWQGR